MNNAVPINKELTEVMPAWLRSIADTIEERGIMSVDTGGGLEYDEIETTKPEDTVRSFKAGNHVVLKMGWTFGDPVEV